MALIKSRTHQPGLAKFLKSINIQINLNTLVMGKERDYDFGGDDQEETDYEENEGYDHTDDSSNSDEDPS
jgi:hypothetical protein